MIKSNKFNGIISSIIILLPMAIGLIFNEHFSDIFEFQSEKNILFFILPLILLAVHWLCIIFTANDKGNKEQNPKIVNIIFYIIPFVSVLSSTIFYSALSKTINPTVITLFFMSLMFIVLGNYLPKINRNSTIGIKIPWTLNNEENWNKTHRFSGKLWVIGGLIMMLTILLPTKIAIYSFVADLIILAFIPVMYSYLYYKKQVEKGTYTKTTTEYKNKKTNIIGSIAVVVILALVSVLMLTGDIKYTLNKEELKINPTYWYEAAIHYDDIDKVEIKTDFNKGIRTHGFGSYKLSFGNFENDEYGSYILYSYNKTKSHILLSSKENLIVINCKNDEATEKLYNELTEKIK